MCRLFEAESHFASLLQLLVSSNPNWSSWMWCANCQADVAAEVSEDNQSARCTTCGTDLIVSRTEPEQRKPDARELLERWSSDELLDPFGPTIGLKGEPNDLPIESSQKPELDKTAAGESKRVHRVDGPHSAHVGASNVPQRSESAAPVPPQRRPQQVQPSHMQPIRSPHFDVQQAIATNLASARKSSNWQSSLGQFLAYLGVLGLTIGTVMVLVSYFGGTANYAPTGWLITTAGQMLLFLGVITLVSGGMEQTTEEVAQRIDRLGERLLRIEQATRDHALRRPNFPAESLSADAAQIASRNERVLEQ